MISMFRICNWR